MNSLAYHPDRRPHRADRNRRLPAAHRSDLRCAGHAYQLPHVKLEKLTGPALSADAVGQVDAVLLSHDQHSDNLDNSGKDFLTQVPSAC